MRIDQTKAVRGLEWKRHQGLSRRSRKERPEGTSRYKKWLTNSWVTLQTDLADRLVNHRRHRPHRRRRRRCRLVVDCSKHQEPQQ